MTQAQSRVVSEIEKDCQTDSPMLRLVQGDVGSGKTIVAALAALQAVSAGYQVAIMAPTEILAEQHYQQFKEWFEPLDIDCAWLSGSLPIKFKRDMLERITFGMAQIVIGTHALFQNKVKFNKLGLLVIDEQHRFGVHQRLALQEKGCDGNYKPHQLIMTATPIPRTLAMVMYADLDTSVIDELPPGRTPVETVAIADSRRTQVIERVRQSCEKGCQAYWVCTLIDESETLTSQAAEKIAEALRYQLPDLKIGLIHGRMKSYDKEAVMGDFKAGHIDVLVATTVIEVGVNVPNASLMIIENPERLGLSQLHQLRGRVGRGNAKSYCVLLYSSPLGKVARERLETLRETTDGFVIAQKDLELRGPGELLGLRQTGLVNMRVANFIKDQHLMPKVNQAADILVKEYPELVEPLINRWVFEGGKYSEV